MRGSLINPLLNYHIHTKACQDRVRLKAWETLVGYSTLGMYIHHASQNTLTLVESYSLSLEVVDTISIKQTNQTMTLD